MPAEVHLSKIPAHSLLRHNNDHGRHAWDINSPTFRHRAVMSLFGALSGKSVRKDANILFRLDTLPGQAPFFLVQSSVAPENIEKFDGALTKHITLPKLQPGTTVSFRITVNAVRRRTVESNGKKRVQVTPVPIEIDKDSKDTTVGSQNLEMWLSNKLAGALNGVEITNHVREVLQDAPRAQSGMTLQLDTIDGIGIVEDPEKLGTFLLEGVGREKAYGCGFLTVRALS
ncbi:type I-E CRISPR-associated protein Cas6/Cse3/CasE [Corynebacterium sp. MSK297]|uniref:type I-E CRISPR-associated protein Cas6/Cse3/CasE n=1 Tax=Corynebacterium sp. MSK297 TaxID=3050221 RepID=UPI00254A1965|nr:type I-E CRISPR-associated protein Cas6/Cse3/CasE [Corynebacterium sp. MSK297]MDK8845192.1 type I-E CRISPR-associated protein Cas6/Cse3/CasE [Corynebacterium sp. MSK297]